MALAATCWVSAKSALTRAALPRLPSNPSTKSTRAASSPTAGVVRYGEVPSALGCQTPEAYLPTRVTSLELRYDSAQLPLSAMINNQNSQTNWPQSRGKVRIYASTDSELLPWTSTGYRQAAHRKEQTVTVACPRNQ